MVTTNSSTQKDQSAATLADRATEIKDKAGSALQSGLDAVKANPGTTAAVVGGVAAAAAAFVARDKIAETAGTLRDKVSGSDKPGPKPKPKPKAKA